MEDRFIASPAETSIDIGERYLLKAIVRLAIQDWFAFKCQELQDRKFADAEQSKLLNYFFDHCDDDDYGSFNYATNHLSDDPQGLRESIRKYLYSGATGLALIRGNRAGNPNR